MQGSPSPILEGLFVPMNVYAIQTKEKSVWSGENVIFYFKNKEKAEEFIHEFNRYPDIDVPFELVGETIQNKSSHLELEIGRDTLDYVDYFSNWGKSFTAEHKALRKQEG